MKIYVPLSDTGDIVTKSTRKGNRTRMINFTTLEALEEWKLEIGEPDLAHKEIYIEGNAWLI